MIIPIATSIAKSLPSAVEPLVSHVFFLSRCPKSFGCHKSPCLVSGKCFCLFEKFIKINFFNEIMESDDWIIRFKK